MQKEVEKDCKDCGWLVESVFKRNGLPVFICNNLKSHSEMEKTTDFRICVEFDEEKRF